LSVLFNEITESGQYSQIRKQGFITPLKKKDEKPGFEGVRPILLIQMFREPQIHFCFLLPCNYYRLSWEDSKTPNCWLDSISIDLQKAFDLVNYNILVEKL